MRTIRVECYSGSRADESPRRIIIEGRRHEVSRVLDSSVEESGQSRERTHRYRVLTGDGLLIEIRRTESGEWFLESAPSRNPL